MAIGHNIYKVSERTFSWSEAAKDCCGCGPKVLNTHKKKEKNMVSINIQVKCAYLISSKEQSHITETSAIS